VFFFVFVNIGPARDARRKVWEGYVRTFYGTYELCR